MARKLKSDAVLFSTTLLLLVISMAWVYSASVIKATEELHDPGFFVIRQGMWVALGMVGLMVGMKLDYRLFRNRTLWLWAAGATVVALVVVLFGRPINHSHRWLGFGGLGIQPSEFAKLVAIFFVATVLERRLEREEPLESGLFQAVALLTVFAGLIIVEPDYGTGIVMLAAAGTMIFVAGLPYRWVLTAAFVLPWPLIAIMLFAPYRRQRLLAFLNPYDDPLGHGWQTIQSLIAVGTGGVTGKGFMAGGLQKMFYLPEAHSDYIFAVIAEESGLIGASAVLLCFGLIVWRGLRVAQRAPDAFGSLLAVGITAMIGIQAVVNLGVVVGLLPSKGIPLPYVSAGGSSMIVSLVAMGVLLNISQQASATE